MKVLRVLTIALVVVLATAAVAYGGDRLRTRDRVQDQLRDGSCQQAAAVLDAASGAPTGSDAVAVTAEPLQTRDRDRLRDGTCGDCDGSAAQECVQAREQTRAQTQAGEQTREQTQAGEQTREQTQAGEQTQTQAGEQTQTREQTQTCEQTQTRVGGAGGSGGH